MLEAVGNSVTGATGVLRAVSASLPMSTAGAGAGGVSSVPLLSPRLVADPEAGVVIAEYLSSTGDTTAQIPSQAVVAYLRSGLTAEGLPKKDATEA